MSTLLKNYGLDKIFNSVNRLMALESYVFQNGKPILGYSGSPYVYKLMGDVELFLSTKVTEKAIEIVGLDIQSHGKCIWNVVHTGTDITPKDSLKTGRTAFFDSKDGDGAFIPIEVITPDVLPSFSKGDVIKLQVVAQPTSINYFANEEEFLKTQSRDEIGGHVMTIGDGALLPTGYLHNHSLDNYDSEKEYETDNLVLFRATVKGFLSRGFEFKGHEEKTFIKCIAETDFGMLEFDHVLSQVPEDQRDNMKAGAIISGLCTISGDAAIFEYNDGIIKDFEHNLQLCKDIFENGNAERLRLVLAENAIYETWSTDKVSVGPDSIIEWLNYVHENTDINYKSYTATVEKSSNPSYPKDLRGIIILDDDTNTLLSGVFIFVNNEGKIEKIKLVNDEGIGFKADFPEPEKDIFEDVSLPESLTESVMLRSEFRGLTFREERDSIVNDDTNVDVMTKNVRIIADYLHKYHTDVETMGSDVNKMIDYLFKNNIDNPAAPVENIIGYLFAKAVEEGYYDNKKNDSYSVVKITFDPKEAIEGHISSNFIGSKRKGLLNAFEFGKVFSKDFYMHLSFKSEENEMFYPFLYEIGIIVQKIGKRSFSKFIK